MSELGIKIEKLTPEQEALIPVYRDKWRKIAYGNQPCDRSIAAEAVKAAYKLIGEQPEVIFCDSPGEALKTLGKLPISDDIVDNLQPRLEEKIFRNLVEKCVDQILGEWLTRRLGSPQFLLYKYLREELSEHSQNIPLRNIRFSLLSIINSQYYNQVNKHLKNCLYRINFIKIEEWIAQASLLDFCFTVLGLDYNQAEWEAYQLIVESCGWLLPLKKYCIVVSRPEILLDSENRLHAEGKPAVRFPDGYKLYFFQNVLIPKRYGKRLTNKWDASWLLTEKNVELRRVLIQGIGYARLLEELHAVELDSYQEYVLLKIDADVDVEPIHLLKMVCPSTKHIHILRVPPNIESAREAIRWVNCGIDPEEFMAQT